MTFETSISIGTVVQLVSLVAAVASVLWKLSQYHSENVRRFTEMKVKVDFLYSWWLREIVPNSREPE